MILSRRGLFGLSAAFVAAPAIGGRLIGNPDLFFARFPEPVGGTPESESKDRDKDSARRNDSIVVFLSEVPNKGEHVDPNRHSDDVKRGATFVGLCVIFGLIFYWASRRRP